MTGPEVRVATRVDLAALVHINQEVQSLHHAQRPDHFKPVELRELETWLVSMLESPSSTVWVALVDGAAVGSAVVTRQERAETPLLRAKTWWYVDQIGVLAANRRQGVCRALVDRVIADAQRDRIETIELSSWAFNREAHDAFRALGFAPKVVRFERGTP
jgi:GNAT superfamily N-acetyltransferase